MSCSTHLTAQELLLRGLEKSERTLPAKGQKDVTPNGSWVQQKQIQEDLESRRLLIADERVDKWGSLSHAEWDGELGLARVTEQRGGHWTHLGHVTDKQLYLHPEEALFLMEVNCLELKYCGVAMSLQQAYALLLNDPIGIREYRVYSELSRVGFKVLRTSVKPEEIVKENPVKVVNNFNVDDEDHVCDMEAVENPEENSSNSHSITSVNNGLDKCKNNDKDSNVIIVQDDDDVNKNEATSERVEETVNETTITSMDCSEVVEKEDIEMVDSGDKNQDNQNELQMVPEYIECDKSSQLRSKDKKELESESWKSSPVVLVGRPSVGNGDVRNNKLVDSKTKNINEHNFCAPEKKVKSLASLNLPDYFKNIPSMSGKAEVTITPPEEDFIPRRVFLHKNSYTLSLSEITSKQHTEDYVPRYEMDRTTRSQRTQIRDNPNREAMFHRTTTKQMYFPPFVRIVPFQNRFKASFYNPFANFHYQQFPFHPQQRFFNAMPNKNFPTSLPKKSKLEHLQSIRRISFRLRKLKKSGGLEGGNYMESLNRLVSAFNSRYEANLQLTENLALVNDCDQIDTVTLDDDEEPDRKRRKTSPAKEDSDKTRLLKRIKTVASKLKNLRHSGEHCFRNRRSLLEAIKVFNKKFDMSITLNGEFDIVDTKEIVLDSSDSDCVVTDTLESSVANDTVASKRTDLAVKASTSNPVNIPQASGTNDFYSLQSSNFSKWLPSSDDWGRAEVTPSVYSQHRILKTNQEVFIYQYLQARNGAYKDWEHLKAEFWAAIAKNGNEEKKSQEVPQCDIEPLLMPEDCVDLQTALEKVRIIKGCSDVDERSFEADLRVTFDVYEPGVKNFKKSTPPVPSYRIVCVDERAGVPPATALLRLSRRCGDAPLALAVVGASLSYVLVSRAELPVNTDTRAFNTVG